MAYMLTKSSPVDFNPDIREAPQPSTHGRCTPLFSYVTVVSIAFKDLPLNHFKSNSKIVRLELYYLYLSYVQK